jgi:hypothetical protein
MTFIYFTIYCRNFKYINTAGFDPQIGTAVYLFAVFSHILRLGFQATLSQHHFWAGLTLCPDVI